ncbi:uncharacterized protein BXZ73DRAFT_73398 [Epithele typhae]|uniref:uncharacterized protein n=1 Tax=Epithele typhae TaxID=378194 RepID=UPI00200794E2|nr:uncharacterized protein BXZ73DRAFT_73398 [Epithele typhae]KAH9945216.1 hypothetical protein BXZ73DRAFT_73398 [Epithele typhae]
MYRPQTIPFIPLDPVSHRYATPEPLDPRMRMPDPNDVPAHLDRCLPVTTVFSRYPSEEPELEPSSAAAEGSQHNPILVPDEPLDPDIVEVPPPPSPRITIRIPARKPARPASPPRKRTSTASPLARVKGKGATKGKGRGRGRGRGKRSAQPPRAPQGRAHAHAPATSSPLKAVAFAEGATEDSGSDSDSGSESESESDVEYWN